MISNSEFTSKPFLKRSFYRYQVLIFIIALLLWAAVTSWFVSRMHGGVIDTEVKAPPCTFTTTKPDYSVISNTPVLHGDPQLTDYANTPVSPSRPPFTTDPMQLGPPVVCIVTAYYNSGKDPKSKQMVDDVVESVRQQTYQQWYWVIVLDNGGGHDQLERVKDLKDDRILVHPLDRRAFLPGARNEGLKLCPESTRYLWPIDSDDLHERTMLEKQVYFLETYPKFTIAGVWSLGFGFKEYHWRQGFSNGDRNLKDNMLIVSSLVRREEVMRAGGYDEDLRHGMEDWDLWLRLANKGHWGYTIPEILWWYKTSPPGKWSSIDSPEKKQQFKDGLKIKYPHIYTKGVPRIQWFESEWGRVSEAQRPLVHNPLKKKGPRLLLIIPSMEIGGADKWNKQLVFELVARGWEVTVVCTVKGGNAWHSEFLRATPDIWILPDYLLREDWGSFLLYLLRSRGIDVVIVSNSEAGYMLVPYLKRHAPQVLFVDYVHSYDDNWMHGGFGRHSLEAAPYFDHNVYASAPVRRWTLDRGHPFPERTSVIRCGVDENIHQPSRSTRRRIRQQYKIDDDTIVITMCSRLVDTKHPEVYAHVLKSLHFDGKKVAGFVVGDGPLRRETEEALRGVNVHFVGYSQDPQQYLTASDIFFLPSTVEGISLAMMEAMSTGLAVVAGAVGGQAELVKDGENGVLLEVHGDMGRRYLDAIRGMIDDRALLRKYQTSARSTILASWTLGSLADNWLNLLCATQKAKYFSSETRRRMANQLSGGYTKGTVNKQKDKVEIVEAKAMDAMTEEMTRRSTEILRLQARVQEAWEREALRAAPAQSIDITSYIFQAVPDHPQWVNGVILTSFRLFRGTKDGDQVLELRLIWELSKAVTKNPLIFLHLRDEKDDVKANGDAEPNIEGVPFSFCDRPVGQVVETAHVLRLTPILESTEKFHIVVGLLDIEHDTGSYSVIPRTDGKLETTVEYYRINTPKEEEKLDGEA